MGFLVSIAVVIGKAFASIWGFLYNLISSIGVYIAQAATAISTAIGAVVTYIKGVIVSVVANTALKVAAFMKTYFAGFYNVVTAVYAKISLYIKAIATTWKAFADFIHLQTLIKIHQIATIVSSDYRAMMEKVYGQISNVSSALGLGVQTLNLALRNARSLILTTSSSFGEPYDIGELKWAQSLSNFLTVTQDKLIKLERDPVGIYDAIDEYLIRDAVNAKADKELTVLITIDKTIDNIVTLAEDIDGINDEIAKFVAGLPEEIRTKVEKYTKPITDKVDEIIEVKIKGVSDTLTEAINIFNRDINKQKNNIDNILDRIKKPGTYIKSIDTLPESEKVEQENIIAEISTRVYRKQADEFTTEIVPVKKEMQKIIDLVNLELPLPTWNVPEILEANPLPQSEQDKRQTWFVGDF